ERAATERGASLRLRSSNRVTARLDSAETSVAQRVGGEGDQPGGDHPQEKRAVGLVQELCQRPVDPDGRLRVVVDGGLDEKGSGEREDDHPREMSDEP